MDPYWFFCNHFFHFLLWISDQLLFTGFQCNLDLPNQISNLASSDIYAPRKIQSERNWFAFQIDANLMLYLN